MVTPRGLRQVTAQAVTPEQLLPYVAAVSDLRPRLFGECVGYIGAGNIVLIGYPLHDPRDGAALDAAVAEAAASALSERLRLTVLAPARPAAAPAEAPSTEDAFWASALPADPPGQKLRNMLRRAAREVRVTQSGGPECWTPEHAALVEAFCRTRPLEPGMCRIFGRIGAYLAAAPGARLFSARRDGEGRLEACAVGDYSALGTAFYMFAFRRPDAPPGTSDALLGALSAEAVERGHTRLNLGLGIRPGVTFFKKKWGAAAFLPYVETVWAPGETKSSWFTRLLGR